MKPSKRIKHALKDLKEIKELSFYFYNGDRDKFARTRKLFENIEDTLVSLAEDKKLFGIKLKKKWDEEHT